MPAKRTTKAAPSMAARSRTAKKAGKPAASKSAANKPAKSKTALNEATLAALGPECLAALLIELAAGDAAVKRRLRLELAGTQSPRLAAREIGKRLAQIARSGAFVDWHKMRAFADDLESQRQAILALAASDPQEAFDMMWRFMALADAVYSRCDDSNGRIGDVFSTACCDLGPLAEQVTPETLALADRVYEARLDNGYGQFDGLIAVLAPALGAAGLLHLKQRFEQLAGAPPPPPATGERRVIGWGSSGALYADDIKARGRAMAIRLALQDIADAQGDVDAYIAQYDAAIRRKPSIAAELAERLVAAGRASEALEFVAHVEYDERSWPHFEFEDVRIAVYEAVGDREKAQAARWSLFERSLSPAHLRTYTGKLPDFSDQDTLERAYTHAARFASVLQALTFLVGWPALDRAAALVLVRYGEIDGDHYEIIGPAAEVLAARHPLAATLLLRAMIDFTLQKARSSRYRHAARHLMDCAGLASIIADFGRFEPHAVYFDRLRREHGRKIGFWSAVEQACGNRGQPSRQLDGPK